MERSSSSEQDIREIVSNILRIPKRFGVMRPFQPSCRENAQRMSTKSTCSKKEIIPTRITGHSQNCQRHENNCRAPPSINKKKGKIRHFSAMFTNPQHRGGGGNGKSWRHQIVKRGMENEMDQRTGTTNIHLESRFWNNKLTKKEAC